MSKLSAVLGVIVIMFFASEARAQDSFNDYKDYGDPTDPAPNNPEKSVLAFLTALEDDSLGDAKLFNITQGAAAGVGAPFKTDPGNRPIKVLKITKNAKVAPHAGREAFLITGCHHAREWISVETPLRIAEFLVNEARSNQRFYFGVQAGPTPWTIPMLLKQSEVLIVPVLNPDGYAFSRSGAGANKFWRKNRRVIVGPPAGVGVDPNRNYPSDWGLIPDPTHTSAIPTRDDYQGPSAGSEVEVQAAMKLHDHFPITSVINFHSWNPAVLYPYAFTKDPIPAEFVTLSPLRTQPDRDVFIQLAQNYTKNQAWKAGLATYPFAQSGSEDPAVPATYQTSGDADDWAYKVRSRISFTVELADKHQPVKARHVTIFEENVQGVLSYLFSSLDRNMNAPLEKMRSLRGRRSP